MPLTQLLDIAVQIAEGLNAAHQKGIIHRDIKPANIFVDDLVDRSRFWTLRLAKISTAARETSPALLSEDSIRGSQTVTRHESPIEHDLSRTGIAMGTAGYMSPEQVRGEELDARTDLLPPSGRILFGVGHWQRAPFSEDTTTASLREAIIREQKNVLVCPRRELNAELPPKPEEISSTRAVGKMDCASLLPERAF